PLEFQRPAQAEAEPLTVPGPAAKPASRYGVDVLYLIREISALVGTLDNRPGDNIARYLRRLADVADTAPRPASVHEIWAKRVGAALEEIHNFQDEDARRYGPYDTIARLREIL